MINKKILIALKTFYDKVNSNEIPWVLSGSFSLELRGVNICAKDIDIIISSNDCERVYLLLKNYVISPNKFVEAEKYRAYVCKYKINGIEIEVIGDGQYRLSNGTYSEIPDINDYEILKYSEMNLRVFPLTKELRDYSAMGKNEKSKAILQKLESLDE